jgi:hypothetical protein
MWRVQVFNKLVEDNLLTHLERETICKWQAGERPTEYKPSNRGKDFPYTVEIGDGGRIGCLWCNDDDAMSVSMFLYDIPKVLLKPLTGLKPTQTIIDEWCSKTYRHEVKHIWVNRKKLTTSVKFDDDKIVKVKLSEGDEWNVYNAVAVAIAEHVYGSNSALKKMIDKKMEIQDKGETHFNIGETLRGVGEEVAKALAGMKDGK